MGFFKDLKEDLSQAVNELIPEEELLGEEEYVDNLDDELLGLADIRKDSEPIQEDLLPNTDEIDFEAILNSADESIIDTLGDELSSTLDASIAFSMEEEDNTDEVINEPELEVASQEEDAQLDDFETDDLNDLIKEFESQILTEEAEDEMSKNMEDDFDVESLMNSVMGNQEEVQEPEELEEPIEEEIVLEEAETEEPIEEEVVLEEAETEEPIEEEVVLEEAETEESIEEEVVLEEIETEEPIEEEVVLEEIETEESIEEEIVLEETEIEEQIMDELVLEETIPEEIEDVDGMISLEDASQLEDINIEENDLQELMDVSVEEEADIDNITFDENEISQQMEEEELDNLEENLDQIVNLQDANVDMDLIAQMLNEEGEIKVDTSLIMSEEFNEVTESTLESKEEISEVIPTEVGNEVTVITTGTRIEGNIISDSSLEIMGTVKGDIECLGKLSVTGHVEGNSQASEIFVNTTKLHGNLVSKGTVKLGAGTVVLGDIEATSAVIAGAVKGEIDVNGPIVVDSTAIVKGNIKAKSVQVNNGAVIDGYCSLTYAAVDIDTFFDGENE